MACQVACNPGLVPDPRHIPGAILRRPPRRSTTPFRRPPSGVLAKTHLAEGFVRNGLGEDGVSSTAESDSNWDPSSEEDECPSVGKDGERWEAAFGLAAAPAVVTVQPAEPQEAIREEILTRLDRRGRFGHLLKVYSCALLMIFITVNGAFSAAESEHFSGMRSSAEVDTGNLSGLIRLLLVCLLPSSVKLLFPVRFAMLAGFAWDEGFGMSRAFNPSMENDPAFYSRALGAALILVGAVTTAAFVWEHRSNERNRDRRLEEIAKPRTRSAVLLRLSSYLAFVVLTFTATDTTYFDWLGSRRVLPWVPVLRLVMAVGFVAVDTRMLASGCATATAAAGRRGSSEAAPARRDFIGDAVVVLLDSLDVFQKLVAVAERRPPKCFWSVLISGDFVAPWSSKSS